MDIEGHSLPCLIKWGPWLWSSDANGWPLGSWDTTLPEFPSPRQQRHLVTKVDNAAVLSNFDRREVSHWVWYMTLTVMRLSHWAASLIQGHLPYVQSSQGDKSILSWALCPRMAAIQIRAISWSFWLLTSISVEQYSVICGHQWDTYGPKLISAWCSVGYCVMYSAVSKPFRFFLSLLMGGLPRDWSVAHHVKMKPFLLTVVHNYPENLPFFCHVSCTPMKGPISVLSWGSFKADTLSVPSPRLELQAWIWDLPHARSFNSIPILALEQIAWRRLIAFVLQMVSSQHSSDG